jgi:uncharacterized glyoxalase superfamily protein PhnB
MKWFAIWVSVFISLNSLAAEEEPMKRLTPILIVEEIEPCLSFWIDRLGFEKTAEAPEGDKLGFVALVRDGKEVMYQTRASIAKEVETAGLPEIMKSPKGPSVLFIEVASLAEIQKKMEGMKLLVPYRETFYGSKELWLQEPGGHIIGFAEMP